MNRNDPRKEKTNNPRHKTVEAILFASSFLFFAKRSVKTGINAEDSAPAITN